jgi:hypothetical protein
MRACVKKLVKEVQVGVCEKCEEGRGKERKD